MSLKKVVEVIRRNRSFLISSHINLEGDALGSELALARLLKSQGKTVYLLNQDKTPQPYEFLPGIKTIRQPGKKILNFEVALLVDCSNFDRIGKVRTLIDKDKPVVNIDHHISNDDFGKINWVDPQASSACEMVYRIYKEGGFRIDREAALLLYVGIMVDTGSFRYSNTTSTTHKAVADLLKYKIPIDKIHQQLYASIPLKELKLLSRILSKFKIDKSHKIAWLVLRKKEINEDKMKTDATEYIFNFLRSIAGTEVAIIFREKEKNKIRVNLRSSGKVNVSQLAMTFGGGGHPRASGCTINTNLKLAQKLVFSKIRKTL